MADEQATPLDSIIGEGADAGGHKGEQAEREQAERVSLPSHPAPQIEHEEKPGMWAYSALKDERAKRQAFQQQVRELQEERDALMSLHSREQQQSSQQQPAEDFWAAPEDYVENKLRTLEKNFSFRIAHDRHGEDFERAWSGMIGMAERGNPSVVQWVMSTTDPGQAMMNWYRQALQDHQQQQRGGIMPSNLSGARNVGSRRGSAWSGPTPLADIFDRGNR